LGDRELAQDLLWAAVEKKSGMSTILVLHAVAAGRALEYQDFRPGIVRGWSAQNQYAKAPHRSQGSGSISSLPSGKVD
jgi:hypothetical protein